MAWRFKASKYKNAAPIVPKFENLIRDLSIGSYRSHGNFIAASAAFMAFNWDVQGSNLAILPLDTKGRQNKASIPLIYAHSDFVTDFQFSPFDDGLLATASQDLTVKLWRIPEKGLDSSGLNQPELVLPSQPRRVETVAFHPCADCILASTSFDSLVIWDLIQAKELYNFQEHDDEVQSLGWQHEGGQLLATQGKDRQLRVLDPRQGKCAATCQTHQGIKDSKLVWIDQERIFTTGFSADRNREITIRDLRNLNVPQKNMTLDMSAGTLIPLFDPDTNMCFLAGKGDRNVQFIELADKEPYIIEGLKYSGEQTKGACLVPKRAMDVMQGEVNRVLQLCDSSVVPITWQVPRKSYREYHSDIYPETNGLEAACGPSTWWKGCDAKVPQISLDPSKRPKPNLTVFGEPLADRDANRKPVENGNNHSMVSPPRSSASSNGAGNLAAEKPTNGHHLCPSSPAPQQQQPFPKPNPRPRCVVKANSAVAAPSSSSAAAANKPQITPRTNGNHSNHDDQVDEGLALLRRQPSIRDRKKLFEEKIQKQQDAKQPLANNSCNNLTAAEEAADVIENKENTGTDHHIITPRPKMEKMEKEEPNKRGHQHKPLSKNIFLAMEEEKQQQPPKEEVKKRPTSKMFVRVSKFKHLKGDVMLKGRFENLKNLSRTVPAECNFIKANKDRIAVPLTGPGGKLAIFETKKPGRIPDGVTPVLINGTTVLDFAFDPFDNCRLAAGCDDGIIRVWKIPASGLSAQTNKTDLEFNAHGDKIQLVKWHPLAKDVLFTAAFDRTAKLWDLSQEGGSSAQVELEGHTDQLFSAEWSSCGRYLASVCKDGKIRIFEPRQSSSPISEGGEIVAKKGARVTWVLDGQYLIVTGFSKQSERQVMVFKVGKASIDLVHTQVLDVSPAILIPFYDEDSSTLFLTSKGESTVPTFEVSLDFPHLFPLSPYRPNGLHQGFAFLPKSVLDVKNVEFARAYRLTTNTIEPISFTVPRVKTVYFQDDLFPMTKVRWEPTLSAHQWFGGSQKQAPLVSLCPEGMLALSGSNNNKKAAEPRNSGGGGGGGKQQEDPSSRKKEVVIPQQIKPGQMAKKAEEVKLEQSVSDLVDLSANLEQDQMEGVDEKEWDEED